MSESKSSSVSLDVYSIKFRGCRDVYPIKIIRPLNKYEVDVKAHFIDVLNSLANQNLKLEHVIADNPKRSFMTYRGPHSAKHSCEYCFETGISFRSTVPNESVAFVQKIQEQKRELSEQIQYLESINDTEQSDSLKKVVEHLDEAEKIAKKNRNPTHLVWPSNTMNGELRTKEKILLIVNRIEDENEEMGASDKKGIKGRSPLLELEYFDFVISTTVDYMHCVCLGLVKRLLELTFCVGESRSRVTKRPLSSPSLFNDLMQTIKVFKEFNRRARKLDLAVMKAQEMRNVILFYFPLVTMCLDDNEKEIKLWQMLAFIIRACILPEVEYSKVNINQIKYCQKKIYTLYEQLFGTRNCTYSVHVSISHLLKMRAAGPLTETSAFRFENFYAELRKAFQPGTVSVLKQMFQKVLLTRILSKHICSEKIYLSENDTAMESNSLIYVYNNDEYSVYKIMSIDDDILTCNQMGNHQIDFKHTQMLNWSSVGVFRKGGLSSVNVLINRNQVSGKVIKVDKYLLTCPNNVLREK